MIIVIPFGSKAEKEEKDNKTLGKESETGQKEYVARLEQQLEDMLVKMDGVGRVKVMITVEDDGKQEYGIVDICTHYQIGLLGKNQHIVHCVML